MGFRPLAGVPGVLNPCPHPPKSPQEGRGLARHCHYGYYCCYPRYWHWGWGCHRYCHYYGYCWHLSLGPSPRARA